MPITAKDILNRIKEENIEMIDFKIVDFEGRFRHVTIPANHFDESIMERGIGFDSACYGYSTVDKSDMVYIPDLSTAFVDPFCEPKTLSLIGDAMIIDSPDNRPLPQYPRNVIHAAVKYMQDSGIADEMRVLPEYEFYLFDKVSWNVSDNNISLDIVAKHAPWNCEAEGLGHIAQYQNHYQADRPIDQAYECRSEMCREMEKAGMPVKYHHAEVGGSGQFEIEPLLGEVSRMADNTMIAKYIISNTAKKYGLSATMMPKPVHRESGSGLHIHMLLMKDGMPVFSDDAGYSHLSQTAHYFIGGILKHIASLCALTNPSTNSYKRLVPGYEAPVTIGYATSNRSAVIRIPAYAKEPSLRRFELRNPDATCNPYFCFAGILMAGLDGIKNKIDPSANGWGPFDFNLFDLPDEEKAKLKGLPTSLKEALDAFEADHDYLTAGNVFPEELITAILNRKRKELTEISLVPNPIEFEKYYNL